MYGLVLWKRFGGWNVSGVPIVSFEGWTTIPQRPTQARPRSLVATCARSYYAGVISSHYVRNRCESEAQAPTIIHSRANGRATGVPPGHGLPYRSAAAIPQGCRLPSGDRIPRFLLPGTQRGRLVFTGLSERIC